MPLKEVQPDQIGQSLHIKYPYADRERAKHASILRRVDVRGFKDGMVC